MEQRNQPRETSQLRNNAIDIARGIAVILMINIHLQLSPFVRHILDGKQSILGMTLRHRALPQPMFMFCLGAGIEYAIPKLASTDGSTMGWRSIMRILLRTAKLTALVFEFNGWHKPRLEFFVGPLAILLSRTPRQSTAAVAFCIAKHFILSEYNVKPNQYVFRLTFLYFLISLVRFSSTRLGIRYNSSLLKSTGPCWFTALLCCGANVYISTQYQCDVLSDYALELRLMIHSLPGVICGVAGLQLACIMRLEMQWQQKLFYTLGLLVGMTSIYYLAERTEYCRTLGDDLKQGLQFAAIAQTTTVCIFDVAVIYLVCTTARNHLIRRYEHSCLVNSMKRVPNPFVSMGRNAVLLYVGHRFLNTFVSKYLYPYMSRDVKVVQVHVQVAFWVLLAFTLDFRNQNVSL